MWTKPLWTAFCNVIMSVIYSFVHAHIFDLILN